MENDHRKPPEPEVEVHQAAPLPATIESRVEASHVDLLEAYTRYANLMKAVRVELIRKTRPQDWVDPGSGLLYLQGTGAERMVPFAPWVKLTITAGPWREETGEPEIPYLYLVRGDVELAIPGCPVMSFNGLLGGRGCDKFFQDGAKGRGTVVNPKDVMMASITSWTARAMSSVFGLRGMTVEDLEPVMGLPFCQRIKTVERQGGRSRANQIEIGQDTPESLKDLPEHAKRILTKFEELLPEKAELWPELLASISWNPNKAHFMPARSIHRFARSEPAASFIFGRLEKLSSESALAQAEAWKETGWPEAKVKHEEAKALEKK